MLLLKIKIVALSTIHSVGLVFAEKFGRIFVKKSRVKFELAAQSELSGVEKVIVEAPIVGSSGLHLGRSDVAFEWNGVRYDVELKTPNTSWVMPGVANLNRPKTKNIASIISDARKITFVERNLLIAFVLFPIPSGDNRWHKDFNFIRLCIDETLSVETHAKQITLQISSEHSADVVVCCFEASLSKAHAILFPDKAK